MSIRSSVTVCLVPEMRSGPFVFHGSLADGMRQAAELGFDAVEIFPPGPEGLSADEIRPLLKEYRLALAAVGTGAGWAKHRLSLTSPEATIREEAEAFIGAMIDAAGALAAPAIVGLMQGRWGEEVSRGQALDWLRGSLSRLAAKARQHETILLYEPLNRYEGNLLTTVAEGVEFLQTVDADNVRLLADLFHMNIEEASISDAIRAGRGHIGHVHFVDSNRRAAGMGHIEFRPIAEALREIAYAGYLSAEAMPLPDSRAAALTTMESFRKYIRP